ncbi:MAG: adenylate/guanylate cyclase domain-containing protein [Methylococcaceae bacterium]|nr:adenylate/guanylate cyclase domain-containing protein [Methylococcaceae bacterium]
MKNKTVQFLILTFVFLSVLSLYKHSKLEFLELYAYDHLLQKYSVKIQSSPVTVITLTEDDFRKQNRWEISDALLADILSNLLEYKAKVIGVDAYRDFPVPPGYKRLEKLFLNHQNIVVTTKFGNKEQKGVSPPPALKNTDQTGLADMPVDRDNTVRRGLLYLNDNQSTSYSLAFQLAIKYLQDKKKPISFGWDKESQLHLGESIIKPFQPTDGGYEDEQIQGFQFLLDYCSPTDAIPRYDLATFQSGNIQIDDFKDKTVLIGTVAESHKDHALTSCSKLSENNKPVSGVLLHAAATDQLIRFAQQKQSTLSTATDLQEILWLFLWTFLGGYFSQLQLSLSQQIMVWIAGLGILFLVTDQFFANNIWLISATPAIAWLLSSILTTAYKASQEKKDRALLMNLFSKHVAPEIAEEIWQNHDQFFAKGRPLPQKTIATVIFTDIQHFTTIAEELDPETLFNWLNDYLEGMTPIVASHKGVVIRFIGDAIFGAFGIPVPRQSKTEIQQDALNAVNCALAMEKKLIELNKKWAEQGLPPVGMRIGLHTGSLATGNIGDKDRMEYTIHGDTVNIAARLEGFDKTQFKPDYFKYPCRLLIGGETLQYIGNQFQVEAIGNITLRGKKEAISVFRITN